MFRVFTRKQSNRDLFFRDLRIGESFVEDGDLRPEVRIKIGTSSYIVLGDGAREGDVKYEAPGDCRVARVDVEIQATVRTEVL